jgi:exopolyphosphatase/guanosine-5'-triphosphate,3'-diphosphate pyrophosphatase
MLCSSIDLGTNTCLLLIAELDLEGRVSRVREDHARVVRLGQGVDREKKLLDQAISRTLACLREYSTYVRAQGLDPAQTIAVATSQARDAQNGAQFFSRVEKETGFKFRTLSGDEEARETFEGALLPDMDPGRVAVIDIGGGSTELMAQSGGQSLDLGSVRFTERYLKSDPVTDSEFWACEAEIDRMLAALKPWRQKLSQQTELVAVAGTATTLATWFLGLSEFDASKVDGVTLTRGDLHRMVEELKWRSVEERKALTGVEAGRADVLLAGAMILWRAHEVLGFTACRISTRGLRYGVLKRAASTHTARF